jgi:hypothetical protein
MNKLEITGLVLMGLLFFVWPAAHSISLRDLLLALNLFVFAYLAWQKGWSPAIAQDLYLPLGILAALTTWTYVVAYALSPETSWSLGEIQSQWWWALAALLVGSLAALATRGNPRLQQAAILVLFLALIGHILVVDFQMAAHWLEHGAPIRSSGLTEGPDKSNYLSNMLFAFLVAALFYWSQAKKPALPLHRYVLIVAWALAVLSEFAERTRNGIITLVVMMAVIGTLFLLRHRHRAKKTFIIAGAGVLLVVVLGGTGLVVAARQSSSLSNLLETIPIGWDTEDNKAWQDPDRYAWPQLPNGETVDTSVYQRIAWFKEGLMLVWEHPLGIGYGRNAYAHGMKAKYGEGYGHSHSGLLDITIGIGIPGALFWVAFIVSLVYLAYRRFRASANYAAILLFLLALDYGVRMLLDSIQRDHMLQQFMFLVGLTTVMMMTDARVDTAQSK